MNILILDDHSLFSQGLGKILMDHYHDLELSIYSSIASLNSAVVDFGSLDVFISDIELPGEDVFELLLRMKTQYPSLPILIISMHNKLSVIKKCKELKIQGYILKDDHELVMEAVESLLTNQDYYSKKVLKTLSILNRKGIVLTPKEEEIISLLANGKNNTEISELLFVTYYT
ncbi:MAG: response regulator, partial [Bacteroidales bacterium]|nr:response regulator [Bacteroidales bacterium]